MPYTEKFNLDGKYDWRVMELTDEEVEEVTEQHKELSKKVMEECLKEAEALATGQRVNATEIAVALFEARCPKLYTLIQNRLQEKIKRAVPKQFFDLNAYLLAKEEKLRGD